MSFDYLTMIRELSQTIWPVGRITGLMLSAPFFSSAQVPSRVKLVLTVTLCWMCASLVPPQLSFVDFNANYIVFIIQDMALGLLMGFILQLVFQIFILGGQIISMQAGLGFAVMMDPSSKASVPFVSQYYLMMSTLIFLSLNGHLAVLTAVIGSFKTMPIGQITLDNSVVWKVVLFSSWMWRESVLISIPAIFSLLVASLSMGIMTKAAPQLNIFSLGFPIILLMGIFTIKIAIPTIGEEFTTSFTYAMNFIMGMLK